MERLIYISQGKTPAIQLENIAFACQVGVKWVQLRLKDCDPKEVKKTAFAAQKICGEHQVKLTINDHAELALSLGIPSVHLGLNDMPTDEARKLLGPSVEIGGTCNTFDHLKWHWQNGVDYVGLGPFRFTKTKTKLSPILGIEGYQRLIKQMAIANIELPVFAIGGIKADDVYPLFNAGVYGIAISSELHHHPDPEAFVKFVEGIFQLKNTTTC